MGGTEAVWRRVQAAWSFADFGVKAWLQIRSFSATNDGTRAA